MARSTVQIPVRPVIVGSRPRSWETMLEILKVNSRRTYAERTTGIAAVTRRGLAFADLLRTIVMIRHPTTRHTCDVALWLRFMSQSVIAINAMFTKRTRFGCLAL